MPRYTVAHRYFAVDNGQAVGPFEPGSTVELDTDRAEWVNRDSPGTLTPVRAAAAKATDSPPPESDTLPATRPRRSGKGGSR